jgi:hypothetical protein
MNDFDDETLPPDVRGVARRLREERHEASPLELDQAKQRILKRASAQPRRLGWLRSPAFLATAIVILSVGGGTAAAFKVDFKPAVSHKAKAHKAKPAAKAAPAKVTVTPTVAAAPTSVAAVTTHAATAPAASKVDGLATPTTASGIGSFLSNLFGGFFGGSGSSGGTGGTGGAAGTQYCNLLQNIFTGIGEILGGNLGGGVNTILTCFDISLPGL